jgi:hypothetical protein
VSTHDNTEVSVPKSLKLSQSTSKDYLEVSNSWNTTSINDDNESREKSLSISSYDSKLTFDHVQESYLKFASIACIFQQYYTKNLEELYEKYKSSTTDDKSKRKSNKQKMFQYCQVILHMLMFLDKMPPKRPNKSLEIGKWQIQICTLANNIESKVVETFKHFEVVMNQTNKSCTTPTFFISQMKVLIENGNLKNDLPLDMEESDPLCHMKKSYFFKTGGTFGIQL